MKLEIWRLAGRQCTVIGQGSDKMNDAIIVVPWDFSRHAHSALEYAFQMYSAESIRVICVLEPPNVYDPGMNWSEESMESARANCVKKFFQSVPMAVKAELKFEARFGEPATEIIRFADEVNAGLIVISTHGRTGIKGLFMGSVAQKVSRYSSCPIMLLPNKWFEQSQQSSDDAHMAQ